MMALKISFVDWIIICVFGIAAVGIFATLYWMSGVMETHSRIMSTNVPFNR